MSIDTTPRPAETDDGPPGPPPTRSGGSGGGRRTRTIALVAVVLVVAVLGVVLLLTRHPSSAGAPMPTNAAMEQALGIRVTQVAVVGDGGLVQVSYLCLDPARAAEFQSDTAHPPRLSSEDRSASTAEVALMKKGHAMTAGQTYYFVYRNNGVVEPDEFASLTYKGQTLAHVPVL